MEHQLDDALLQELAVEIVREVYPVEALLKRFTIDPRSFAVIARNRRFIAMLAEAQIAWDSTLNTRQRIKIKGDVIVEQMMLKAYEYYSDPAQPLAARAKLLETVAKISGAYEEGRQTPAMIAGADSGRPSDRVSITINLHPHGEPAASGLIIDQPLPVLPPSDATE